MCARERAAILHSLHYSLRTKGKMKPKNVNPYYNANYVTIAWGRFLCNRFFRRRSSLVFWWSVRAVRTNIRQGFLSAATGWWVGSPKKQSATKALAHKKLHARWMGKQGKDKGVCKTIGLALRGLIGQNVFYGNYGFTILVLHAKSNRCPFFA